MGADTKTGADSWSKASVLPRARGSTQQASAAGPTTTAAPRKGGEARGHADPRRQAGRGIPEPP